MSPQWTKISTRVKSLLLPNIAQRLEFYLTSYRHGTTPPRGWVTLDGSEILVYGGPAFDPNKKLLQANSLNPFDTILASPNRQEFYEELLSYPDKSVNDLLLSSQVVTRGLLFVDRRVGKRRIVSLSNRLEEHSFIRQMARLRQVND
jgi:hypothetical protein